MQGPESSFSRDPNESSPLKAGANRCKALCVLTCLPLTKYKITRSLKRGFCYYVMYVMIFPTFNNLLYKNIGSTPHPQTIPIAFFFFEERSKHFLTSFMLLIHNEGQPDTGFVHAQKQTQKQAVSHAGWCRSSVWKAELRSDSALNFSALGKGIWEQDTLFWGRNPF